MRMTPITDFEVVKAAWDNYCERQSKHPSRRELVTELLRYLLSPSDSSIGWYAEPAAHRLVRRWYKTLAEEGRPVVLKEAAPNAPRLPRRDPRETPETLKRPSNGGLRRVPSGNVRTGRASHRKSA
jgi:hypothetical protein